MREKPAECTAHVNYVSTYTECHGASGMLKANGIGSSASPQSPAHHREARIDAGLLPNPGGRLKFFKDGKFILELSHRRDGDRTTWFPVPKKTFWPPASTTPNRQESSTSLSVSDDNSSIQSSPWQRDHCWKQANPRRCVSTELNFYYRRDRRNRSRTNPRVVARKRRRPLEPTMPHKVQEITSVSPGTNCRKNNGGNSGGAGQALGLIIDKLSRLLDPNVVSPRKRILRELERVTLEDQASKRRATPQPTTNVAPKQLSSYSITSILGEDKPNNTEPGFLRNLLKLEDGQTAKYSTSHSYPRNRLQDPYVLAASANASAHHPLYGVPMLPPGPYRSPLWMHYPPPVHYPPPLPIYPPPPTPHPSSSPVHHYKDYREQALTPPSDMPLNLSKHAG